LIAAGRIVRGRSGRSTLRVGAALGRLGAVATGCMVLLFPVYWMLLNAIQPTDRALVYPPPLLPTGFDTMALMQLFSGQPMLRWLLLSGLVALLVVVLTVLVVVPAAYALSALRWNGRVWFGLFLLVTQMMPGAVIIAPILLLYRYLGWTNSLPALSVVQAAFAIPICAWILKSSFDSVPREIMEAGEVDGGTRLLVLRHIVLPLAAPGIVAVCVVAFFSSWNEYLFACTLITDRDLYTGSLGLGTLITQFDTPLFVLLAAGVVFSILPIAFYMAVQRHVLRGLTAGAVKG
jgi:multiple sugar transport system permease protein